MKLYQIANEYQQAFDAMTDDGLSHEIIADSLAGIGAEFEEKAKVVASHIQNLEAEAVAIKDAQKRMQERHSKTVSKVDSLKKYLLTNMRACDMQKINTPEFAVSIRKNPPKLIIDENKLADFYYEEKTERVIMKDAIKAAINSGLEVTGAHLERGERLHFE